MITTLLSLLALENLWTPSANTQLKNPLVLEAHAYPQPKITAIKPVLTTKSILSMDLNSGKILYQQNSEEQLPMASLTKLMTAKIILDENKLDEIVTVNKLATQIEPAKIYLLAGEKITIKELLKALFIKSANDAALALAFHNSSNLETFVMKMNKEAKQLGLTKTHFTNPVGFDDPNQYSTVGDLAILARSLYRLPLVQELAIIKETDIYSYDHQQTHQLKTTNELLSSYLKVLGLKTGTTDAAGQCLISIVENSQGHQILNILLGSSDRFKETKILSQWLFNNIDWI